ncbi:hypothetical protein ACS0TY_034987 [Phlomoides rotata]
MKQLRVKAARVEMRCFQTMMMSSASWLEKNLSWYNGSRVRMDGHNAEEDDFFPDEHVSPEDGLHDDGTGFHKFSDNNVDDKASERLAFETIDEADLFYNSYGTRMGFNVKRCHKRYNKQKTIVKTVFWEYSQAGFPRICEKPLRRKLRPQTRFRCQACFHVAHQDGMYKVTKFVSEHNHQLLTPTSNQLKSNRFISLGDKAVMTVMNGAGHRTCHILDYLKLVHGGPSNLSLKNKDAYNFLNKKRNELVRTEM